MRSTHRRRAPARSVAASVLALGLALAGGSPAIAAGPAAPASAETHAPTPGPAVESGEVELVVAPVVPVVDATATEVEFDVQIANTGEAPLPNGTVSLALELDRIADESSLDEALEATEQPLPLASRLGEAEVGRTAAHDVQRTTITVPRSRFLLPASGSAGVYVVRATLAPEPDPGAVQAGAAAPREVTAQTPVVWQGAGGSTVPVSVIVPLVLPDAVRTLPTRAQLAEIAPRLDELLTRAQGRRATLAIDPRLIAGIRAYGTEAPDAARDLLARLEATSLPSFLLQFADADPAAQAALGMPALLQPESLDFVTRFGTFDDAGADAAGGGDTANGDTANGDTGNGDTANEGTGDPDPADADASAADSGGSGSDAADGSQDPGTAEAGATGSADAAPTVGQLVEWDAEATTTAWPAEGGVDAGTLSLLDDSGYDSVVLDSANAALTGGPVARVGGMSAIVSDAGSADAARTALGGSTESDRASGVAELAARLALAAQQKRPGLVLALDRGAVANSDDPAALLELLAGFDWAEPVALDAQRTGRAELRDAGVAESRLELLRAAVGREGAVDEIGAVLAEPVYLTGYQRARLLELFATRHAAPGADFEEIAADYRRRDAELLEGVQAASTEHTQLVGTSTQVPVLLHNSLPFDAVVDVEATPSSAALALPERRFTDVVVPAEANERVLVPVRSRVSSGESGLVLSVTSASGDLTVFTGTLPISIRSSVEAIALWSLGALAALLLGFGILRSVRRRRRGDLAGAPEEDVAGGTDGVPVAGSPAE